MRAVLFLPIPLALTLIALAACSDDDPATTPAVDAGSDVTEPKPDAGSDHQGHDAGAEAAAPAIRCTEAELAANDRTDGGTFEIGFELGANPKQYTNRCVTVKAGSSVTFAGSFEQHPLEAAGGDSPNPIPYTTVTPAGGKLVVTMPNAGTFGFRCEFHPSQMYGAIKVVL